MLDLLDHPLFQALLAPFLAGLLVAMLMAMRPGTRSLQGLAILVGVGVTAWLSIGLEFEPLTSTRKIVLCSLTLPWVALVFARGRWPRFVEAVVLSGLLALAALWVVAPVLGRQEGVTMFATGARVALFAAAISVLLVWFSRQDRVRQGSGVLALALSLGLAALTAASALYAQLAIAVAASTVGLLLVRMLSQRWWPVMEAERQGLGSLAVFSAAVPLGLVGGAATVYAQLPPSALLFLLLPPVVAALPLAAGFRPVLRLSILTVLALLAAAPAIAIAWYSAGAVVF
ncbi:MAG: hypothetical protein GXP17_03660 [Gammaproteobacteria bacterium]|nr:hypothetical protein [Gammaproteobacteria bacterium]